MLKMLSSSPFHHLSFLRRGTVSSGILEDYQQVRSYITVDHKYVCFKTHLLNVSQHSFVFLLMFSKNKKIKNKDCTPQLTKAETTG